MHVLVFTVVVHCYSASKIAKCIQMPSASESVVVKQSYPFLTRGLLSRYQHMQHMQHVDDMDDSVQPT